MSFTIHRGEVLGIAGVEGNGQAELVEAIMGMRPLAAGSIRLGGDDISAWRTRRRREAGIGYIPEDRHRHGLLLDAPLWENRILGHQTEAPNVNGPLDRPGRRPRGHRADRRPSTTSGRPASTSLAVVAVRRQPAEADRRPGDERRPEGADRRAPDPRRRRRRPGRDLGPHPQRPRATGLAVLLISADLDELIGLSDTLRVILRGRLVADVDPPTSRPRSWARR